MTTAEDARKDFEDALKGAGWIMERTQSPGIRSGAGERAVIAFSDPGVRAGAVTIMSLRGKEIHSVEASLLRSALSFEGAWCKLN